MTKFTLTINPKLNTHPSPLPCDTNHMHLYVFLLSCLPLKHHASKGVCCVAAPPHWKGLGRISSDGDATLPRTLQHVRVLLLLLNAFHGVWPDSWIDSLFSYLLCRGDKVIILALPFLCPLSEEGERGWMCLLPHGHAEKSPFDPWSTRTAICRKNLHKKSRWQEEGFLPYIETTEHCGSISPTDYKMVEAITDTFPLFPAVLTILLVLILQ